MFLVPHKERNVTAAEFADGLRAELLNVPDLISTVTIPAYVSGVSATLNGVLQGPDLDELSNRAKRIQQLASAIPGVAQLDTSARDDKPEIRLFPNRPVLSDLGIPPSTVAALLRADVDGLEAGEYKQDRKTVDIRVKLAEREGTEQVSSLPLPGGPGRPIPISTVTEEKLAKQKIMIYRLDKNDAINISGNERRGYAAQTVYSQIEEAAQKDGLLDTDYHLVQSGMTEIADEAVADFAEAIILAAALTYLTLAAILESFSMPLLVLSTLPMALIGVVAALKAWHLNISIFVMLGAVLLIGVVVNPAVLIIDRMLQLRRKGETPHAAIQHAVAQTFRAVLMVIVASGLGMLPIALSTGVGAVNRIAIGSASVGGILVAGVLTLTVLPMIYFACTRKRKGE